MWPIIICVVIGAAWAWFEIPEVMEVVAGVFVGSICGVILAMILGMIFYSGVDHTTIERGANLENMVDNTETQGAFFLGSGSIDGEPMYSWYEETKTNTFKRRDVEAYQADIHYITDGDVPHYTKTIGHYRDGFLQPWGLNMLPGETSIRHYDFYIPRGSITNEYRLDAQ